MSPNIDPVVLRTLLSAAIYRPDGATLTELVQAFADPKSPAEVKRWVDALVAAEILQENPNVRPHRYEPLPAAAELYRNLGRDSEAAPLAPPAQSPVATAAPAAVAIPSATGVDSAPSPAASTSGSTVASAAASASASADARAVVPVSSPAAATPGSPASGLTPASPPTADSRPAGSAPMPPAAAVPDAAATVERFRSLFDPLIRQCVIGVLPRASVLPILQDIARRELPASAGESFVHYGLERLERLSLGECLRVSLDPSQYEVWRRGYFPPSAPAGKTKDEGVRSKNDSEGGEPTTESGRPARKEVGATADGDANTAAEVMAALLKGQMPGVRTLSAVLKKLLGRAPGDKTPVAGWLWTSLVVGVVAAAIFKLTGNSPWFGAIASVLVGGFWMSRRAAAEGATGASGAPGTPVVSGQARVVGAEPASGTRSRLGWLAGICIAAVAAGGGFAWYQYAVRRPPEAAVAEYLRTAVAPLPLRVAALGLPSRVPGTTGCRVIYDVRFEVTQPLYRKLDTLSYLRAKFPAELAAIDAAHALLNDVNGARIRAVLGGGAGGAAAGAGGQGTAAGSDHDPQINDDSTLSAAVLLTTTTLPGASATAKGELLGWRSNGQWAFSGDPVRLDHAPVGEPKPDGAAVYVVDAAAELARLKSAVQAQAADAARVKAAADAVAAELQRTRQQRIAELAQWLRPQTLLTGQVSGVSAPGGTARIAFEITAAEPGAASVSAVLHNDGGWTDARPFQGEWTPTANAEACVLTLRTTRYDRIVSAGPLLDEPSDWGVVLKLTADGVATIDTSTQAAVRPPSGVIMRALKRVDPTNLAATRMDFSRTLLPALAATKPGQWFRGTVTSRLRTATETLLLRFTAQDADGTRLEATLLSPTNSAWSRPFRGAIIDNTYCASGSPIRLQTLDSDRVLQAPTWSMLATATGGNNVALNLRVDGNRLVGADGTFDYTFEPAPDGGSAVVGGNGAPNTSGSGALDNRGADAPRILPAFPDKTGAYVLTDNGGWAALPTNNSRPNKSLVQWLNSFFAGLKQFEARIAGTTLPPAKDITANLVIDGSEPVPTVDRHEVVLLYAGALVLSPKLLNEHPELAAEPAVEVGPLWTVDSGARMMPLVSPVKGLYSFGPLRIAGKIEHPAVGITLWRCAIELPPRHYALDAGDSVYEFGVK